MHDDEVSDQGEGSEFGVDFLDEIIGDVRVGAGQESCSTDLTDWRIVIRQNNETFV